MQSNANEVGIAPTGARGIEMWVVYDSPEDLPGRFVARKWLDLNPTDHVRQAKTLEWLRQQLPIGLSRLERQEQDDPKIVEVWL